MTFYYHIFNNKYLILFLLSTFSFTSCCPSQLEVLHLLSSSQKAELLLSPEMENQDYGTLTVVFNSLLTGAPAPPPSGNLTVLPSPYDPYSPQSGLSEVRQLTCSCSKTYERTAAAGCLGLTFLRIG